MINNNSINSAKLLINYKNNPLTSTSLTIILLIQILIKKKKKKQNKNKIKKHIYYIN